MERVFFERGVAVYKEQTIGFVWIRDRDHDRFFSF